MKRFLFVITLYLYSFSGIAQSNSQDSAWIAENYTKLEQYIPMRDGIRLFTAIYLPKDKSEKHPILMTRTPYSCAPYGTDKFSANLWNRHWRYYARENYIIVVQDVRGRWMSEGEFEDVRPFNKNKTGRKVVNRVKAYMKISDGKIAEHSDAFRLSTWLAQALGWKGKLLGWTGFMKRAVQKNARKSLIAFIEKNRQ